VRSDALAYTSEESQEVHERRPQLPPLHDQVDHAVLE
jgi:hypothetical protein